MYFVNLRESKISQDFFEKILESVFNYEKLKEKKEAGVILVGKARIRRLNKRFRGINKVTDVLSFPYEEIQSPTKKELQFIEPQKEKLLGEIVLCPSYIKKQARRFKRSFEEELALSLIHGMLHLLGYDHMDTKGTKEMREKEKGILDKIKKLSVFNQFSDKNSQRVKQDFK